MESLPQTPDVLNAGIGISFTQLLHAEQPAQEEYVFQKLVAPHKAGGREVSQEAEAYAQGSARKAVGWHAYGQLPQPKLASKETVEQIMKTLPARMKGKIEKHQKCILSQLPEVFPLADGEEILSDLFTFLEEPFKAFQRHSSVLIRRTNMAEYCIHFPTYIVNGAPEHSSSVVANGESIKFHFDGNVPVVLDSVLGDFAKSLGTGLLNGIAGQVGALIFDQIFPPSVPSYFSEVYKQIEKIIHDQLTQNVIDELNGKINGVKDFVANTYTPLKNSGTPNKALYSKLSPEQSDFVTNVIGVLETDRYATGGFTGYMIAAGMHLAILQELALVSTDELKAGYVDAIKKNAASHAQHAQNTYDNILQTRRGKISLYHFTHHSKSMYINVYGWKDDFTDERHQWSYSVDSKGSHGDTNAQEDARKSKDEHESSVISKLISDLDNPQGVIDDWKKLEYRPLPPR